MKHYRAFYPFGVIEITPDDENRLDNLHKLVNTLTPAEVDVVTTYVRMFLNTRLPNRTEQTGGILGRQ